jgi:hypothetical protein
MRIEHNCAFILGLLARMRTGTYVTVEQWNIEKNKILRGQVGFGPYERQAWNIQYIYYIFAHTRLEADF